MFYAIVYLFYLIIYHVNKNSDMSCENIVYNATLRTASG